MPDIVRRRGIANLEIGIKIPLDEMLARWWAGAWADTYGGALREGQWGVRQEGMGFTHIVEGTKLRILIPDDYV